MVTGERWSSPDNVRVAEGDKRENTGRSYDAGLCGMDGRCDPSCHFATLVTRALPGLNTTMMNTQGGDETEAVKSEQGFSNPTPPFGGQPEASRYAGGASLVQGDGEFFPICR